MTEQIDMTRAAEVRPAEDSRAALAADWKAFQKLGKDRLLKARDMGRLLCEEKLRVGHGNWGLWLERNAPFSAERGREFMRVYERWDECKDRESFTEALTALAKSAVPADLADDEPPSPTQFPAETSVPKPLSPPSREPSPPAKPRSWSPPATGPSDEKPLWKTHYEDGHPVKVESEELKKLGVELGSIPTEDEMKAAFEACKDGIPPMVKKAVLVARALKQVEDLNVTLLSLVVVCSRAPGLSDTKPVVDRLSELLSEFEPTSLDRTKRIVAELKEREGVSHA